MFSVKSKRLFATSIKRMKAKVFVLNKKFDGFPKEDNFKLIEEDLPPLKSGEFLTAATYLSVDSHLRILPLEVGETVVGQQVARIIKSENPKYSVDEFVFGEFGWRSHTIATETPGKNYKIIPRILQADGPLPASLALEALGIPGLTANLGFLNICKPVQGNTVVVSGAAGAVGTLVGQIAKAKGCRVVGITGSDEKGQRLIDESKFDAYVNYKDKDFEKRLAEATPNLIDCYYDNVGGEISSAVLQRLQKFARVAVGGAISTYNEEKPLAREVQTPVKISHATMEGFDVRRWKSQWDEAREQNKKWIEGGLLTQHETVTEGFKTLPSVFINLFLGQNFGKSIVKAS